MKPSGVSGVNPTLCERSVQSVRWIASVGKNEVRNTPDIPDEIPWGWST